MSKPKQIYALVDANNFYASCEKIFRPDLENRPVVVLSNNDGCIVARSKEAKALGIGMAVPYFKVKKELEKHNTAVFSSNYALYGDISQRIMSILEKNCKEVEQYSIDEAFLVLDNALVYNMKDYAFDLRNTILQWTGIQVSIGFSSTRTLAKLANYLTKKNNGIFYLDVNDKDFPSYLENIPVDEVWGIGRKSAIKLKEYGIKNTFELSQADDNWIRKNLTVRGWNTVLELRGIVATTSESIVHSENDEGSSQRKSIMSSRSFSRKITEQSDLEEALSSYAVRAGERLRNEKLYALGIHVFLRTSKHGVSGQSGQAYYAPSVQFAFKEPTNDTRTFLLAVKEGLQAIYKPDYHYAKGGVLLFGLSKGSEQKSLLDTEEVIELRNKSQSLMQTIDKVNSKLGRRSLYFGSEGKEDAIWQMKQEHKSQGYINNWDELAIAECK